MSIEFKRFAGEARFLAPTDGSEVVTPLEIRIDQLTGRHGRLAKHKPPPGGMMWQRQQPDLSELIKKSVEMGCPFCWEAFQKRVPKFSKDLFPEGWLRVGEAVLCPTITPLDIYHALVIVTTDRHFIGMGDFTRELLANAFMAGHIYLKRVCEYDPGVKYPALSWNYLPAAGGGLPHPHLQPIGGHVPSSLHGELAKSLEDYSKRNSGSNFWADLIAKEQELGERYVGTTGNIAWLTSFVSQGRMADVMAIFKNRGSLTSVTEADWNDFATGLVNVFRYFKDQGIYAFNGAVYFSAVGRDSFWTSFRLVERSLMPPLGLSDISFFEKLHDDAIISKAPEDVCAELKKYFD